VWPHVTTLPFKGSWYCTGSTLERWVAVLEYCTFNFVMSFVKYHQCNWPICDTSIAVYAQWLRPNRDSGENIVFWNTLARTWLSLYNRPVKGVLYFCPKRYYVLLLQLS